MPDPLVGPMDLSWEIWVSATLACLSILTAWQLKKEAGGIAKTFSVVAAIVVFVLTWLPPSEPLTVIGYFLVTIGFLLGWLLAGMSTADNMGRRLGRSLIFLVGAEFSLTLFLRPILHAGEASALMLIELIMWILTFSTTLAWVIAFIFTPFHHKKARA